MGRAAAAERLTGVDEFPRSHLNRRRNSLCFLPMTALQLINPDEFLGIAQKTCVGALTERSKNEFALTFRGEFSLRNELPYLAESDWPVRRTFSLGGLLLHAVREDTKEYQRVDIDREFLLVLPEEDEGGDVAEILAWSGLKQTVEIVPSFAKPFPPK